MTSHNTSEHTEEEFFQRIDSSTLLRCMKFPTNFYKNYVEGKHRDGFVTLKSPLLSKPSKVKREGGKLKEGWKEFAKLHELKVGNYVHFTHEGNFVFYVTTFTEKGNRILYTNNKINQVSIKEAATMGPKRKSIHATAESENFIRSRDIAGIVIKDAGNSSFSRKQTKKGTTSLSVDNSFFFQAVTVPNLRSSSFYIPMKFARENRLKQKKMGFVGLVNSAGDVWASEVTLCTDNRLKIFTGWETFCSENNIQVGDCCKFKLQPEYEWIMLELVGVSKGEKKPDETIVGSSWNVKDEQHEVDEDYGPGNDVEFVDLTFEEKPTFEKGQSSRKQKVQMQ